MKKHKKILVDMSASIIHHGHIRLLKKASKFGEVIVGLTTDKDLKKFKKINPEIKFKNREEILRSIKYVKKVIPSSFIINEKFLIKHNIDLVVNGSDYKNRKFRIKSIYFGRTKNISSSKIRKIAAKNYEKNKK
tara:strand:- start:5382 stop:5783 length:402 start_codon:yes stop_codon:yes gene_type:complete